MGRTYEHILLLFTIALTVCRPVLSEGVAIYIFHGHEGTSGVYMCCCGPKFEAYSNILTSPPRRLFVPSARPSSHT